ncbi:MAG: ATP-binding protein [Nitrospirae bacterium]|nr:ATP-binding protein [Nitrospirota bacterium]
MIGRRHELSALRRLLRRNPVVGIIGARQVGKTTLARALARGWHGTASYFDLEHPQDLARLSDPMLALQSLKGLVVIDEVQRAPGLFEVLRVLADRPRRRATFLILGSASPELLQQGSESLAGRIAYVEIGGLILSDVGRGQEDILWLRGGFPRSLLARTSAGSFAWRQEFVRTFLERDLPQLGVHISSITMRRFWTMLAHTHGQTWNSSEFARAFGVADTTVRGYLDRLSAALVVRQLLPWHENISKRQVKAPKVYITDSGLLHALLNLRTRVDVEHHPKVGASWEGFVLDAVIRHVRADRSECFYWATHGGAELDLLMIRGRRRLGFEVKRTMSPSVSPSMRIAMKDLGLTRLDLIYPGDQTFPLAKGIRAVAFPHLIRDVAPLPVS